MIPAPIAKARISMRSQANAGTSADHDDFLNISGDVIDVNKTGLEELSSDETLPEDNYEQRWV